MFASQSHSVNYHPQLGIFCCSHSGTLADRVAIIWMEHCYPTTGCSLYTRGILGLECLGDSARQGAEPSRNQGLWAFTPVVVPFYRYTLPSVAGWPLSREIGCKQSSRFNLKCIVCNFGLWLVSLHSFFQLTMCWHHFIHQIYSGNQNIYSSFPYGVYD